MSKLAREVLKAATGVKYLPMPAKPPVPAKPDHADGYVVKSSGADQKVLGTMPEGVSEEEYLATVELVRKTIGAEELLVTVQRSSNGYSLMTMAVMPMEEEQ